MSLFRRRTPVTRAITCPYCLVEVRQANEGEVCSHCSRPTPVDYYQAHPGLRPLPIQAFGWSNHGKSVYLTALTLVLCRMSRSWPGYTWLAADDETQNRIRRINSYLASGELPPPTARDADSCHLMLLRNLGRWGDRALVYRDCAGELFDRQDVPVERVPFLLRAPTTLFVVSPTDLARDDARMVDMLLENYLATLASHGVAVQSGARRLIVVLTKGDLVADLPGELRDYLQADTLWEDLRDGRPILRSEADTERLLGELARTSDLVRRYFEERLDGTNFVRLCQDRRIEIRFTIVSATGGEVMEDEGVLVEQWHPRRVLDPVFWALTAGSPMPTLGARRFDPRARTTGPAGSDQRFRPRPPRG